MKLTVNNAAYTYSKIKQHAEYPAPKEHKTDLSPELKPS